MFYPYSQALLILLCILFHQSVVQAQHLNNTAIWCTVSEAEQRKCEAFARAVDREIAFFGYTYISLQCRRAFNKEECMAMIDQEQAQLTTLDAGEVFLGGRYHSLVPIMQEIYNSGVSYQYAVAVLKKGTLSDVQTLHDLRGKKACFAGVGTLAGWILPIHTLIKQGGMQIIDCNNHVKSAITYFGASCAVNSLIDKYNPLGDNSDQLCKLCIGKIPGERCTIADPYAGYEGALRCLNNVGEIAFVVHTTVEEMTLQSTIDFTPTPERHNKSSTDQNVIRKEKFELLCRDGSRRPIDEYRSCNWGTVPSRALVTSSATELKTRRLYQKFFDKAVHIFNKNTLRNNSTDMYNKPFDNGRQQDNFENRSGNNRFGGNGDNYDNSDNFERSYEDGNNDLSSWNSNPSRNGTSYRNWDREQGGYTDIPSIQPIEVFNLFESVPKYGVHHNLMFSDVAKDFYQIPEKDQTYTSYLGRSLDSILGVRDCPVDKMTLCVTSDPEMEKCIRMRIALKAQLLKPELVCYKGHSQINCMQAIRSGIADVTVLDASDVYTAALRYHLIPFISEVYNLGTPEYYVVAVAKEEDDNTDLTYLKNKNTCHPGINTAAGWVIPMAYLISNFWIRGYGCDSVRAAAEYFSKSCIPGALSTEYNTGVPYDNMCDLCHGVSYRYCRRDASEDYFGYTGAFRCLVEGGGDVAFVKHTTVTENASGKRREFWARNTFIKDFELLCPDGTRKKTTEYESCNLGKAPANAVVTRGGEAYNETQLAAFINLFVYAQQFYGRKEQDDFSFSMFYSPPPYSDLIFQDATQQLMIIPPEKREFNAYLGPNFMRARRIVDCKAGASANKYSLFSTLTIIIFIFVLNS